MILASIFLVLVGCTTLVIGILDSSVHVVYISIGCTIVAGAVLVQCVRAGSGAGDTDDEGTVPEEPPWPPDQPVQWAAAPVSGATSASGVTDARSASGANGARSAEESPGPYPAVALIAPPPRPPTPWPAIEPAPGPALDLMAPGPGVLGRLRRQPLAGGESPRQPQTTPPDGLGSPARRSGGEPCSAGPRPPRPPSASSGPKKAGAGPRKAPGPKAPAVPGPPGPRGGGDRVAGKAAAKKAARSAGRPGPARQTSRIGKGPTEQARHPQKAASK